MSDLTVAGAMTRSRDQGVDRLDAQLLLGRVLGCTRTWLLAHDEVVLSAAQRSAFETALDRRARGEPLAYVLGEKEFHGLVLTVTPSVLVPRPETECLVDWGLALLTRELTHHGIPTVLDLGTGSGAIALAVKAALPHAHITGVDISPDALVVARTNSQRLGLDVQWKQGDWWSGAAGRRFVLVLSNPPYIRPGDPHLLALEHEPRLALTPGGDGLNAFATIVDGARNHLEPGGWLLLEHGHDQAADVRALLGRGGFSAVRTLDDLAGLPRCTGGRLGHIDG